MELDPEEVKRIKNLPPELRSIGSQNKRESKSSAWLESNVGICNTILACDAFLVSGKSVEDYTIMYSFMVPSFEAYQRIIKDMESAGIKVTVLKMGKFEPQAGVLTDKQERIFWLALKGGYFDYPPQNDNRRACRENWN